MRTWNFTSSAWYIGTKRSKRRSRYPREEWPPTVLRVRDTNTVDEVLDYFVVSASLLDRARKQSSSIGKIVTSKKDAGASTKRSTKSIVITKKR